MKATISILVFIFAFSNLFFGQTSEIAKINHLLDTETYYDIQLDCKISIVLPDSVKMKFLATLRGEVPQKLSDSILFISEQDKKQLWNFCRTECKEDSICTIEKYNKLFQDKYNYKYKKLYDYYKVNKTVVLAAGSWNIREAIPILQKAIGDTKYDQPSTLMALAKLGNDSIYQQIKESRSLSYLISHTEFDTINNNTVISENIADSYPYGINDFPASYLKDKYFLYDMFDLLYLKGQVSFLDSDYISIEASLLMDFTFILFQSHPHVESWRDICNTYSDVYIDAQRDTKLYKQVSSHGYKQKMITELKKWIDENVNFE